MQRFNVFVLCSNYALTRYINTGCSLHLSDKKGNPTIKAGFRERLKQHRGHYVVWLCLKHSIFSFFFVRHLSCFDFSAFATRLQFTASDFVVDLFSKFFFSLPRIVLRMRYKGIHDLIPILLLIVERHLSLDRFKLRS